MRMQIMKWISVEDRLPKRKHELNTSDDFLVYGRSEFTGAYEISMGWFYFKRDIWETDLEEHNDKMNVTHWMPLPKPPKS